MLYFCVDPQGWIFFKDGSINGSRYVIIHKPMTFYGAQDACRDQGGHLAHVNSIREQVFIEEYLKQILTRHSEYSVVRVCVYVCRDQGGHLTHVNSIREQVFIEEYLKQILTRHSEYSVVRVCVCVQSTSNRY